MSTTTLAPLTDPSADMTATHPLLSLVAAVFWAFCECLSNTIYRNHHLTVYSMAFVLGQVSDCIRNDFGAKVHLRRTVLLPNSHCKHYIRALHTPSIAMLTVSKISSISGPLSSSSQHQRLHLTISSNSAT